MASVGGIPFRSIGTLDRERFLDLLNRESPLESTVCEWFLNVLTRDEQNRVIYNIVCNYRFQGAVMMEMAPPTNHLKKIPHQVIVATPKDHPDSTCVICLDDHVDSMLKECEHSFHRKCIKVWFKKSHQCPLCRQHKTDL